MARTDHAPMAGKPEDFAHLIPEPQAQTRIVVSHLPTGKRAYSINVTGRSQGFIDREVDAQRSDMDRPADWSIEVEVSS